MKSSLSLKTIAAAVLVLGSVSAQAQLQSRDVNHDGLIDAFYDVQLNITWLADMDYARTSDYDTDGLLNLQAARSWAQSLDYFGATGWRLPNVTPVNGSSFNYTTSVNGSTDVGVATTGIGWGSAAELGHLFYVSLGNSGEAHPNYGGGFNGVPLNTGSFRNLTSRAYWSGPDYGMPHDDFGGQGPFTIQNPGWDFDFWDGSQDFGNPSNSLPVVAVHNGDVFASAVPEPGTYVMMLMGLALVAPMARRRSRKL